MTLHRLPIPKTHFVWDWDEENTMFWFCPRQSLKSMIIEFGINRVFIDQSGNLTGEPHFLFEHINDLIEFKLKFL